MRRVVECFYRMLAVVILVAFATNAAAQTAPSSQPSARMNILAYGGEDNEWIVSVLLHPPSNDTLATNVQSRGQFTDQWTWVNGVESQTVSVTQRTAGELTLLFDSGHWMSVWTDGAAVGPDLPPAIQPIVLAGGEGELFALARGPLPAIDLTTQPSIGGSTRPAAPTTAATNVAVQLGLFELVRDQWKLRARVTTDAAIAHLTSDDVSLGRRGSGSVVAAIRCSSTRLQVLQWNDGFSRRPAEDSVDFAGHEFGLLARLPRPMLWTHDGSPAGQLRPLDALRSGAKPLPVPQGLKLGDACDLHEAFGGLRLLFEQKDQLFSQAYSSTGELQQQPVPLVLVSSNSAMPNAWYEWISLPIVVLLTFFLFNPVRRPIDTTRQLPRQQEIGGYVILAPLGLRFWAGLVDALPVLIVAMYVASQVSGAPTFTEQMRLASQWEGLSFAASVLYFLHTVLGELFTQKTFGKWLFGLRTVDTTGQRPGVLAIVVRCLIRVVEMSFILPLLLIVFTPLRQRLGDLASNTVVVLDDPDASPPDEE